MDANFYASQWFLTFLCYDLPMEIALKVIDYFLLDGWKIFFGVILALLKFAEGIGCNFFPLLLALLKTGASRRNKKNFDRENNSYEN